MALEKLFVILLRYSSLFFFILICYPYVYGVHQDQFLIPSSSPMFVDVLSNENVAKALQFTCEINRQLSCSDDYLSRLSMQDPLDVNEDSRDLCLTVFHQARPRPNKVGVERWGPELSIYLRELQNALDCSPMCKVYALIYLDRACSMETRRNAEKCPFLVPRTVHRLLLTAMVMAAKATDPETIIKSNALGCDQYTSSNKRYAEKLRAFGITEKNLAGMEAHMLAAMGEERTFVQDYQVRDCFRTWANAISTFSSSHHNVNSDVVRNPAVTDSNQQMLHSSPPDPTMTMHQSNTPEENHSHPAPNNFHEHQQQPATIDDDTPIPPEGSQDIANSIGYYWT